MVRTTEGGPNIGQCLKKQDKLIEASTSLDIVLHLFSRLLMIN